MNVSQLKNELEKNPNARLRFILPNGESVPAHAHVTEVARVDKRFIDCGGTLRNDSLCRLQMWTADDVNHRLVAGKLGKIMEKAAPVLLSDELEIDVEYEVGFISQFPLEQIDGSPEEIVLRMGLRHTACLALDKCQPAAPVEFNPLKANFREPQSTAACCGGRGC
jgi:hypothetical protein